MDEDESVTNLRITGRLSNRLCLRKPVGLTINRTFGAVVVADDVFNVYGLGKTLTDAVTDFRVSLGEYYELVAKNYEENPCDAREFLLLQGYVEEVE